MPTSGLVELLNDKQIYGAWLLLHKAHDATVRKLIMDHFGRNQRTVERVSHEIWSHVYQRLRAGTGHIDDESAWVLSVAIERVPSLGSSNETGTGLAEWLGDVERESGVAAGTTPPATVRTGRRRSKRMRARGTQGR